jgi:hypothetical protein
MPHSERLIGLKVLMVDDELLAQTVTGRAVRAATRYRNGSATPALGFLSHALRSYESRKVRYLAMLIRRSWPVSVTTKLPARSSSRPWGPARPLINTSLGAPGLKRYTALSPNVTT